MAVLLISYSYPKPMYICCYVFVCSSCLCHVLYLIVDTCLCFEVFIFYYMYRDMVSPSDEEKLS